MDHQDTEGDERMSGESDGLTAKQRSNARYGSGGASSSDAADAESRDRDESGDSGGEAAGDDVIQ